MAEERGPLGRAGGQGSYEWAQIAAVLGAIAGLGIVLWRAGAWLGRNTIGGRARAHMELSVALEQGGDDVAEQMAHAAGVNTHDVYDWHAAWKTA